MVAGTSDVDREPRRGFVRKVAVSAGALTLAGIATAVGLSLLSREREAHLQSQSSSQSAAIFGDERLRNLLNSEITTNDIFNVELASAKPGKVDLNDWTLRIHGAVSQPIALDMDKLLRLPAKSEYYTLECVYLESSMPVIEEFSATAKYTGVPLAGLLDEAGTAPSAKYVVFRGTDGYDVGIPMSRAIHPGTMLAYRMNDQILPGKHGFPLRAIVPGMYGQMNPKRVTEIEVVEEEYIGLWQRIEHWSNDLVVKTISIIRYPEDHSKITGRTPIAGVAFAGDRGISKVEVSVDGGDRWSEAALKKPLSPYTWVLWGCEWTPPARDLYTIVVRAYDGKGQVQNPEIAGAWPDGASGYHSIHVTAGA
jgi:DMSO/TMAO reductase YedYZ molybdopterin-dependent catalytic subunit